MSNLQDFEAEISEQTAALESLLSELEGMDIAEESLFTKDVTVDDLLEKVKDQVDKCEGAKDCEELLSKLEKEEKKFNSALDAMKDAVQKCKDGDMEKDECKEKIRKAAKDIKDSCDVLKCKEIDEECDDCSDEDIQMLHDFLTGARDIITEKADSFGSKKEKEDDDDEEKEDEETADESMIAPATEGAGEALAVGGTLALYAALVGLAAKQFFGGSSGKEDKYIRVLKKDLAPKLKALKAKYRAAKKANDFDAAISADKEMIKLHNKLLSEVKALKHEVDISKTKSSDGTTTKKTEDLYNVRTVTILNKIKDDISALETDIKILNKKKAETATESFESSYMEGYKAALEAFGILDVEDEDVEDTETAEDSTDAE